MKSKNELVQQAISDLTTIRRAMDRAAEQREGGDDSSLVFATDAMIQIGALLLAGFTLAVELATKNGVSDSLMLSKVSPNLQVLAVSQVGFLLLLLSAILYFLVWRSSKQSSVDFSSYVARNFQYLKQLSFIADLLVKYSVFVLLLFAGKGEWIAPLLLLFTGDYLVQGRLFTLPLFSSLLIGGSCMVGAIVQFYSGSSLLLWPLLAFVFISIYSLIHLASLKRQQSN